MKKNIQTSSASPLKHKESVDHEDFDEHNLEILKAVAQAWHGHSGSCRTANEFDAYRRNFYGKPSRFKLEAMNKKSPLLGSKRIVGNSNNSSYSDTKWDFKQSLLDSYEIVSMAKRLERGMVLDNQDPFPSVYRKKRESKNSLRNLFNRLSSRRFNDNDIPDQV